MTAILAGRFACGLSAQERSGDDVTQYRQSEHSNLLVAIAQAPTLEALEALRVTWLGKHGQITAQLKQLGLLPPAERKSQGQTLNRLRDEATAAIASRKQDLAQVALDHRLASEQVDVTLPGRRAEIGSKHPISLTLERLTHILSGLGFTAAHGPEIEDDWHNFEALNFPPHHPARTMHDTFYVDQGHLLRTHTSGVQIRHLQNHQPPVRMYAAGKVYRSDADQTHSPMFHQIEGLLVDEHISFTDLKGLLLSVIEQFFATSLPIRFRPSYFPFTEPSAEVDIAWQQPDGQRRWLEVLGCGMVHPHVFHHVGIDPERYNGLAFGLGIERLAMLRYGIVDLRAFYDNDARFLRQFV